MISIKTTVLMPDILVRSIKQALFGYDAGFMIVDIPYQYDTISEVMLNMFYKSCASNGGREGHGAIWTH